MDCCNNKNNKNGSSSDSGEFDKTGGCCSIVGKRWVWLPYEDHYLQSAQLLSMLCLFVSWVWWVTFVINLAALLPIQIIWCSRQTKAWMLATVAVAILSGLASIGTGVYVATVYPEHTQCLVFTGSLRSLDDDDPFYDSAYKHADHCNEVLWATIAIICGFLWFVVAGLIAHFVRSGAHEGWEECHEAKADETNKYVCGTNSCNNSRHKGDHNMHQHNDFCTNSNNNSKKVDNSYGSKVDRSHNSNSQTTSVESGRASDELTPPVMVVSMVDPEPPEPSSESNTADLEAGDEFPEIKDPWTETGSDRKERKSGGGTASFLVKSNKARGVPCPEAAQNLPPAGIKALRDIPYFNFNTMTV